MNAIVSLARRATLAVALLISVVGCAASIPHEALQLSRESLAQRQLQTRIFETGDERFILHASAAVLQDTGFSLDESETSLGVIVGSKDRSAVEGGQVAGQIAMAILFGVYQPIDEKQKIRVSLVSHPSGSGRTAVRVTFQRLVWNQAGQVTRAEFVGDPGVYQDFFDKLSQGVFLSANQI